MIAPTNALPYSALGNVTYLMEVSLEIRNQHLSSTCNINVYAAQYQNWSIEVPGISPSLQKSLNKTATPCGYGSAQYNQTDKYNNTIDYYSKTLGVYPGFYNPADCSYRFRLSINYTLTAMQIRWDNLGTPQMSDYDTGSYFYKIYTQNQSAFINTTDPAITSKASEICGSITNPVEKARAIYTWVSKNIEYEVQTDSGPDGTGEKGASWALANLRGDCSEYSDLMVTLLRAQGVPARKVAGIALLDAASGGELPSYLQGATWTYYKNTGGDNITGHAWVEYFVPGVGWVACDPTWGHSGQDYFNYIDYLHVSAARGSYFGDEVNPTLISLIGHEIGEYPPIPLFTTSGGTPTYEILFRFTVVESNIWSDPTGLIIFVGILVVVSIVAIIYWVASGRRKKARLDNKSL